MNKVNEVTIKRLKSIRTLSLVFIGLAVLLLAADWLIPTDKLSMQEYLWYRQYIHGNWAAAGLAGGILLLYSTMRLEHEERKDTKKS